MDNLEDLQYQFYIASGIIAVILLILFILIIVIFVRVRRLSVSRSHQTEIQSDSMGDFCYTNPVIVPGEELSRRGYSMYRAENSLTIPSVNLKNVSSGYEPCESHSRF